MRVIALVCYPLGTAPGQRYRMEQWAPYLRAAGIEVEFVPFASLALARLLYEPGRHVRKALAMTQALLARFTHAWSSRRYDAVYVFREASLIGPALAERLARWRRPAFVYDLDDAVWVPYVSPSNRYFSYLKFPWKTAALCRMARTVLAGNAHLADYARRVNDDVTIVPSTVSMREYRARPAPALDRVPVVGWTGSHSSVQYLDLVKPALARLAARRRFRFLAIGAGAIDIPGVETEFRPWRPETEVEDLWEMDVGIMPLPDESWARGKCAMKAIQYMGVGVPPVVSPVGVNSEVVQDGCTGLLARSEEQWVEALDGLLGNPQRRERMGREARAAVEARYSAEVQWPRVAEVLRRAAASEAP